VVSKPPLRPNSCVGKRYTPSWSVFPVLGFKYVYPGIRNGISGGFPMVRKILPVDFLYG